MKQKLCNALSGCCHFRLIEVFFYGLPSGPRDILTFLNSPQSTRSCPFSFFQFPLLSNAELLHRLAGDFEVHVCHRPRGASVEL